MSADKKKNSGQAKGAKREGPKEGRGITPQEFLALRKPKGGLMALAYNVLSER